MQEKPAEPLLEQEFAVQGGDFIHAGEVSSRIKAILKDIGMSHDIIRRVAIATYEAEMNVVCYARQAAFHLAITPDRLMVIADDEGQGIPDIEQAMQEGFSTSTREIKEMGFGAGMGLPNIKRNTDELLISSVVNEGTRVAMVIFTQR